MTKVLIYSAVYGGFDTIRPQPVPIRRFTDISHPLAYPDPRMKAKWWKVRPDLACPDADVTIWIDGSMDVLIPDLAERCLDALGDLDALFVRHQERDDIYEEAAFSRRGAKYAGQPMREQVERYRADGHPEHWGLIHAAFLVRRNSRAMRSFDQAWWREITHWSIQDQLSLPPLLRTLPLRWRFWDVSPLDVLPGDARWVHWGTHAKPDVWLPEAVA
jgi:TOD1/MUCI70, glycosyltransferase-like domain